MPSAIILTGPPYLDFLQHRQRTGDIFERSRDNLRRANQRPTMQRAIDAEAAGATQTK